MSFRQNLEQLPATLRVTGQALVDFTHTLCPGDFQAQGAQWIYRPSNFIAMSIQAKRSHRIVLSLCGTWRDFVVMGYHEILKEHDGRWAGYTAFKIESPRQLSAAAAFIEKGYEIYLRRSGLKGLRIETASTGISVM